MRVSCVPIRSYQKSCKHLMSTRHKSTRRRPHETRARDDDDQMLARWCNTGPLNVRGIVACERCLRAIVMRVSSVPSAHSPHASMRPACTIDNAGPVRWMSEVSLPTSVAYEPFPPASEGCQDSRRTRVAKLQSASESSTEDRATRQECIPWQATHVEQNTHVASASGGRHRTPPRFNAASLNHRQCWHAGATPVH